LVGKVINNVAASSSIEVDCRAMVNIACELVWLKISVARA